MCPNVSVKNSKLGGGGDIHTVRLHGGGGEAVQPGSLQAESTRDATGSPLRERGGTVLESRGHGGGECVGVKRGKERDRGYVCVVCVALMYVCTLCTYVRVGRVRGLPDPLLHWSHVDHVL